MKSKNNMHSKVRSRYGSSLKDGKGHQDMHEASSRRAFLRNTGLFSLGSLMAINGHSMSQLAINPLTMGLLTNDTDRTLILIRLNGGNDGLNTVVERGNDEYYNIRPTIAISEEDMWNLSDEIGMPNTTLSLQPLWEDGRMKVIHNVGYPQPNFSHFRSSDIWASASDSNEVIETGWIGRAMEAEFGSFLETPPSVPPAIQIGIENNLIFAGSDANMSLSISNPTEFYRIAQQGQLYNTAELNSCPAEAELKYARQTANNAFRYSSTIQEAYRKGTTKSEYPDNYLAEQLAIVARLIKGQLGTKVYMVTLGGFDTHSNQNDNKHPKLMTYLSEAIAAFMADMDADNLGEKVLGMTFSEFGRTIYENGSFGTDHGTGGPMILFGGEELGNGFVGTPPDLINTDDYGDPGYSIDFRSVYGSILDGWLGIDDRVVDHVLGDQDKINGLVPPGDFPAGLNAQNILLGYRPSKVLGHIDIQYSLNKGANTRLSLVKLNGTPYRTLFESYVDRGSYTYTLDPPKAVVEEGSYMLELRSSGKTHRRHILVK